MDAPAIVRSQSRQSASCDYCQGELSRLYTLVIAEINTESMSAMKSLLPYYERELGILRRLSGEFSARHPKLAGQMMLSGEVCGDPHVERLIQVIALLNARITKRLSDDYSRFTAGLLSVLYPHFLRAIPAYSIARFDFNDEVAKLVTEMSEVPRGIELKCVDSNGKACRYSTAFQVPIRPYEISRARFVPIVQAPAGMRLASGAMAEIEIEIATTVAGFSLERLGLARMRVYIAGESSFRATLRDTLFMRTVGAYVEPDGDGRRIALEQPPIAAAGFADSDALIPFTAVANNKVHHKPPLGFKDLPSLRRSPQKIKSTTK